MTSATGRRGTVVHHAHVLLADQDGLERRGISRLLDRAGYRVAVEGCARTTLKRVETGQFDALVLDPGLGDALDTDVLGLCARLPTVIVTARPSFDSAVRALRARAVDYFTKPVDIPSFLRAVERATATVPGKMSASDVWAPLTLREREVVRVLSMTPRATAVAQRLSISPNTARNHLKAVFRKVGVGSQLELIELVREHGVPRV